MLQRLPPHVRWTAWFGTALAYLTNYCRTKYLPLTQARFTDHSYLRSGAETVLLGGVCAAVAFFVGGTVASYLE